MTKVYTPEQIETARLNIEKYKISSANKLAELDIRLSNIVKPLKDDHDDDTVVLVAMKCLVFFEKNRGSITI